MARRSRQWKNKIMDDTAVMSALFLNEEEAEVAAAGVGRRGQRFRGENTERYSDYMM